MAAGPDKKIEAELEQISKDHGGLLRPADVVEFARDKKTALHERFTWDNTKAADEYRLWEARRIILKVLCHVSGRRKQLLTRAYVSLKADRTHEGGYRTVVDVLSDADHRAAMLAEAKREMEHFQLKYRVLDELADVFAAMRRVLVTQIKPAKRKDSRRPAFAEAAT